MPVALISLMMVIRYTEAPVIEKREVPYCINMGIKVHIFIPSLMEDIQFCTDLFLLKVM